MTLALILAIVFGIVWFNHNANLKINNQKERARTITNIKLQDELFCKNFTRVMDDLNTMDKATPLVEKTLMEALEFLYEVYDIPDRRTEAQKQEDLKKYIEDNNELHRVRPDEPIYESILGKDDSIYPDDDSILPLYQRIWYPLTRYSEKQNNAVFLSPHLLIGIRNSQKELDGVTYCYDDYGYLKNFFNRYNNPLTKIIQDIVVLLTTRDVYNKGYNFSPLRKDSWWQETEKIAKEHTKNKEKYPWLYRRD